MNTKLITGVVLLVGIVLWIAWDLYVNFNVIVGDTISELAGATFARNPILAVALGVVCGHLVSYTPAMAPVLAFIRVNLWTAFLYGFGAGFLFWNMARDSN